MKNYDVAIIGAGSGGLSARKEVAKVTDSYVVIDPGPLGTTCARVGCMPSKVLVEVAKNYHKKKDFPTMGISRSEKLEVDMSKVMQHVRKLRDRFVRGVMTDMERWRETHFIEGHAKFESANVLKVNDEKISAKSIIVATGSKPILPDSWRPYSSYFLDTDSLFEEETVEGPFAVIGLGAIGLELGQALARLGLQVTGITRSPSLAGVQHPELQKYLLKNMSDEFPIHVADVKGFQEKEGSLLIQTKDKEIPVRKALLAMGRKPCLGSLGLENTGIPMDAKGLPKLTPGVYKSPTAHIYFVGDVNGERTILHEASDEGRIAGYNAVHSDKECFKRRCSLGITFSQPNVALVGENHKSLREKNIDFVEGDVCFEGQGRAIVKCEEKGLLKIYAEKKTGRLLGSEIFAPDGEHLAHLIAWSLESRLTIFDMLSMPFYHPVIEEGLRTALRNTRKKLERDTPALEVMRCEDPPAGA